MNATKRKFNTLLQGLSEPRTSYENKRSSAHGTQSTTPIKKTADVDALLEKRRELGLPLSNASALHSPSSKSTKSSSPSFRASSRLAEPTHRTPGFKEPLARFCPGDRNELLKRLATFQELTDWTPKPDRVSEIEWAKRGWVCRGKERVRCVLCNKELVVKLNKQEVDGKEVPVLVSSEIEDALIDKYVELVVDAHSEDCLWRKQGCDDSLLRLPVASTANALDQLRQRYDELCARSAFLPYEFNLRLPDSLNISDVLSQLPGDFFKDTNNSENASDSAPNRVALALSLLGWQGLSNARIGQVPNSASCHTCLRRLGLWMFKSKEVGENGEVLVPAPMDYLDPLREHRFFCPWKNASTQRWATGRTTVAEESPGWAILLQTIQNNAHLRSVYEGRPRSRARSGASRPSTPAAPATPGRGNGDDAESERPLTGTTSIEDDDKERDAKDKERWARLKRVKSLFDIKGNKIRRSLSRSGSRPGTAHSARSGATENAS